MNTLLPDITVNVKDSTCCNGLGCVCCSSGATLHTRSEITGTKKEEAAKERDALKPNPANDYKEIRASQKLPPRLKTCWERFIASCCCCGAAESQNRTTVEWVHLTLLRDNDPEQVEVILAWKSIDLRQVFRTARALTLGEYKDIQKAFEDAKEFARALHIVLQNIKKSPSELQMPIAGSGQMLTLRLPQQSSIEVPSAPKREPSKERRLASEAFTPLADVTVSSRDSFSLEINASPHKKSPESRASASPVSVNSDSAERGGAPLQVESLASTELQVDPARTRRLFLKAAAKCELLEDEIGSLCRKFKNLKMKDEAAKPLSELASEDDTYSKVSHVQARKIMGFAIEIRNLRNEETSSPVTAMRTSSEIGAPTQGDSLKARAVVAFKDAVQEKDIDTLLEALIAEA